MNSRRTVIVSVILFFIGGLVFRNQIARAVVPLARSVFSLTQGVRKTFEFFESRSVIMTERDALRKQVQRLAETGTEATLLRTENQELRALLGFQKRASYAIVPAHVIGLVPEIEMHGLILDRGARDGLSPGMPVITGNGLLIGKLHQVAEYAATVMLLTDARSSLAATIANAPGTHGVIVGGKGFGMRMELIPQQDSVSVGDIIFTSGLESGTPRGLTIGMVEHVAAEERKPFQTATIRPLEEYTKLLTVAIIASSTRR